MEKVIINSSYILTSSSTGESWTALYQSPTLGDEAKGKFYILGDYNSKEKSGGETLNLIVEKTRTIFESNHRASVAALEHTCQELNELTVAQFKKNLRKIN